MAHCFFFHDEMINCGVSTFYAGIKENGNLKFVASYLENGLADFVDTYVIH